MYWGALFGGSTTSILFNIPGEPSSVATTFDGYPMAKQGRATEALTLAFLSAGFGALAGVILITLLSGWVARFALRFSSPEYFAVYFLAFASFVGLGGASPLKTIVSMGIGFALRGRRHGYGLGQPAPDLRASTMLLGGVSFLIAVIGLFGIGELLLTMEEGLKFEGVAAKVAHRATCWPPPPSCRATGSRCCARSLIGIWMGITPGGPTAASFMSYAPRQALLAHAASASARASPRASSRRRPPTTRPASAAMLPMLALGIPGSATAAVMMGGLMIWGLNPGPMLFTDRPDFVWGLIASMYLGNVVAVMLVLATVPLFASILRIPFAIIGPVIVVVCFIGAYTVGEQGLRHLAGAGLRPRRLRLQEARLPDRAAGARHGDRRQGRGCLPPVDDLQRRARSRSSGRTRWSRP